MSMMAYGTVFTLQGKARHKSQMWMFKKSSKLIFNFVRFTYFSSQGKNQEDRSQ